MQYRKIHIIFIYFQQDFFINYPTLAIMNTLFAFLRKTPRLQTFPVKFRSKVTECFKIIADILT